MLTWPKRRSRALTWGLLVLLALAAALLVGQLQVQLAQANVVLQEGASDGPEANLSYLFAAFAIIWALFFAYLFVISRRERELRREVEELRRELAAKEPQSSE